MKISNWLRYLCNYKYRTWKRIKAQLDLGHWHIMRMSKCIYKLFCYVDVFSFLPLLNLLNVRACETVQYKELCTAVSLSPIPNKCFFVVIG